MSMLEFLRESKDKGLPGPNPKQNSKIRAKTAAVRFGIARELHEAGITATQVTVGALILKTAGYAVAEWQNITGNKNKFLRVGSFVAVLAGELGDAIDGPLSTFSEKDPNGGHKDTLADRAGEVAPNFFKAIRAHLLGHRYGSKVALINAVETTLPSAIKGEREAEGYSLPENVRGIKLPDEKGGRRFLNKAIYCATAIVGFLGGRTGRPFLNMPATFFPETQPVLDTIQIVANTYAAEERVRYPFDKQHKRDMPEELQHDSLVKTGLLAGVMAISYLGARALNRKFNSKP